MPIIVPPELTRLTRVNAGKVQKAAAKVVTDSGRGAGKSDPPKFGSVTNTTFRSTAAGFRIESSGVAPQGAEYGGRRRSPRTYMTHRGATSFSVRRRTTMQFLPYNPRGYAITPRLRSGMAGIRNRIVEAVQKAMVG